MSRHAGSRPRTVSRTASPPESPCCHSLGAASKYRAAAQWRDTLAGLPALRSWPSILPAAAARLPRGSTEPLGVGSVAGGIHELREAPVGTRPCRDAGTGSTEAPPARRGGRSRRSSRRSWRLPRGISVTSRSATGCKPRRGWPDSRQPSWMNVRERKQGSSRLPRTSPGRSSGGLHLVYWLADLDSRIPWPGDG